MRVLLSRGPFCAPQPWFLQVHTPSAEQRDRPLSPGIALSSRCPTAAAGRADSCVSLPHVSPDARNFSRLWGKRESEDAETPPLGDHCHRRRIRCRDSATDPNRCQTCADFDLPCTYRRPIKRGRGPPSRPAAVSSQPPQQLQDKSHASPHQHLQPHPGLGQVVALGANSSSTIGAHQTESDVGTSRPPSSVPLRSSEGFAFGGPAGLRSDPAISRAWKGFAIASAPLVHRLFEVYHETVYPMYAIS